MADRVFVIQGVHHEPKFRAVVITPDTVTNDEAIAAWSYAVRYSAKGYDVPDYEAAVAMMLKRHPNWQISPHSVFNVPYDPAKADVEKKD